jgi:hypothetical protein
MVVVPVSLPESDGHFFPQPQFTAVYRLNLLVGGQWKLRCLLALVSMHVRTLLLLVVYTWFSSPG